MEKITLVYNDTKKVEISPEYINELLITGVYDTSLEYNDILKEKKCSSFYLELIKDIDNINLEVNDIFTNEKEEIVLSDMLKNNFDSLYTVETNGEVIGVPFMNEEFVKSKITIDKKYIKIHIYNSYHKGV